MFANRSFYSQYWKMMPSINKNRISVLLGGIFLCLWGSPAYALPENEVRRQETVKEEAQDRSKTETVTEQNPSTSLNRPEGTKEDSTPTDKPPGDTEEQKSTTDIEKKKETNAPRDEADRTPATGTGRAENLDVAAPSSDSTSGAGKGQGTERKIRDRSGEFDRFIDEDGDGICDGRRIGRGFIQGRGRRMGPGPRGSQGPRRRP